MRRLTRTLTLSLLCACLAGSAGAWEKKAARAAAARATEAFSTTSFVAKMPLGRMVHYYVLPDGSPATKKGKRQGKGPGATTIQFDGGIKVKKGHRGEGIRVWAKKDEIRVGFYRKRGAHLNPALVHILFDRQTRPGDYDPHKIARAVSSLVEIRGYEPGSGVAAALDEAIEEAAAAEASEVSAEPSPSQREPTIVALTVRAEPERVLRGGEVHLVLSYEIGTGGGVAEVRESRSLALGGEMMPTFPVVEELRREAGTYTSSYEQPLPASASPGRYTFTGEVCVGGDCIQRSAGFEVVTR